MKIYSVAALFLLLSGNVMAQDATTVARVQATANEKSPAPSNQPANQDANAAELVALTNAWTNAINSKDRSKLDELMAPDYALYGWNGELLAPRAEWMDNLFNHLKISAFTTEELAPRVYGDFAIVTSVGVWAGTVDGDPFNYNVILVDTWRKMGGRWQVVARNSHREDVLLGSSS
jgi:ketosteroid isomerase-like protein